MLNRILCLAVMLLLLALPSLAEPQLSWNEPAPYPPVAGALTSGGYEDTTLSITNETIRAYDTDVLIVRVHISEPWQLRTATAAPFPSQATARVDRIASRENAVLAINGDFFTNRSVGYIIRNGTLLRDVPHNKRDILLIDYNGDFRIIHSPTANDVEGLAGQTAQAFSFGPGLVIDGVRNTDCNNTQCVATEHTQRLAICQTAPLTYMIIAAESMTIEQLSQLCLEQGAINAYNLDGGNSTTVVLCGTKLNDPSQTKQRSVGDILYFATAQGGMTP